MASGLRVSEALALEVGDLSLAMELPTTSVRQGKGRRARIVPVHPELRSAFTSALQFGNIDTEDKIVKASRSTAGRWVREAMVSANKDGQSLYGGASPMTSCDTATLGIF